MTVSSVGSAWNPQMIAKAGGGWASFGGAQGSGASAESGADTSSGSGTVATGSTDFAQLFMYENFTGGTNGANISTVSSLGSTGNSVIADDPLGIHGKVAADQMLTSQTVAFSDGFVCSFATKLARYDEAWARLKVYMPIGYSYAGSPWLKWMRWHVDTAAGHGTGHIGYADWYIEPDGDHRFIFEGENSWHVLTADQSKAPILGQYQDWETHIVFDTVPVDSGGQARIDFWRGGVLIGSVTDRRTMNNTTDLVSEYHFMSFVNGGPPQDQILYYTKFALALKQAGVRDDTPHLSTDSGGKLFIGTGGT